jgi:hypothetical protein
MFPAALAGAGVRGGTVFGTSDKDSAHVVDHPVSSEFLAATIYHALGILADLRVTDALGRPAPIVAGGAASPRPLRLSPSIREGFAPQLRTLGWREPDEPDAPARVGGIPFAGAPGRAETARV